MTKSLSVLLTAILTLIALTTAVLATPPATPAWWTTGNTSFIDETATPNNYAPLNIGQLKNVAAKAKIYLDTKLSPVGGSGPAITSLVNSFSTNTELNYQPANLGQLKAVAKPFYERLIAVGYDARDDFVAHGFDAGWLYYYPWIPYSLVVSNYSPANLGQLKMVFGFEVDSFVADRNWDSNGNGLSDSWELALYGNLHSATYTSDIDGDGVPDYQDADPSNSRIGLLSITITYPINGASL